MKIRRKAVDFVLQAARNVYPAEFIGLLKPDTKGAITEVLLFPGTTFAHSFSAIDFLQVPIGQRYVGSVHSHPGWSNRPSAGDLRFFSHYGRMHLIICLPFDENSIAAYDNKGKPIELQIVD